MPSDKQAKIICKIKDDRWTTKDKLDQYRGILKLYGREKKLKAEDHVKLKKKVSLELTTIRSDVQKFHAIVNAIVNGVAGPTTRSFLLQRDDLRLKHRESKLEDIFIDVSEETHFKRRQLDKLRYERKKKLQRCFELQFEHAELSSILEREEHEKTDPKQQRLIANYQEWVSKQNAAKAVHSTYESMIDILKQDLIHHDLLLNSLKEDQASQCKVILKTTIMGQLVAEYSDDIAQKYKRMTRDVVANMKERENALNLAREHVQDLWTYAKSLIRDDADAMLLRKRSQKPIDANIDMEKQIKSLEQIFERVKDSLLVRSYRELFARLEEQAKQRTRLFAQFELNLKNRDSLVNQKNEALTVITGIQLSNVASTEEFNTDKNALIEQIEIQKTRELEFKNSKKENGELLMNIRGSFQSMIAMLVCVQKGKSVKRTKDGVKKKAKEIVEHEELEEQSVERIESEGLALLSTVGRKVGALFGMSNFDLEEHKENRARDLYQIYVSEFFSKHKFDEPETEFFLEHKAIDSSVPTRAEIKLQSKQIVDTFLKEQ